MFGKIFYQSNGRFGIYRKALIKIAASAALLAFFICVHLRHLRIELFSTVPGASNLRPSASSAVKS
jgi:hypothetical protein